MMHLLDTDISSYAMKRRNPGLIARIRGFARGELKVSTVTVFELEYGARRSPRYSSLVRVIDAFLPNVEVLSFDRDASREAGEIRAELAGAGKMIGAHDLLIAGHARSLEATLVTNNVAEFSRVRDLKLENWANGATQGSSRSKRKRSTAT
jgi:tRNA(fMet)-specific endonuclease VapC